MILLLVETVNMVLSSSGISQQVHLALFVQHALKTEKKRSFLKHDTKTNKQKNERNYSIKRKGIRIYFKEGFSEIFNSRT